MGVGGAKPVTDKPEKSKKPAPAAEKSGKNDKVAPANHANPGQGQFVEELLKEIRKLRENSTGTANSEDKELADQKFLTVFFKMLQVLAEKNDRPVNVIRAMADPYTELNARTDGIEHHKRSPLTLSAKEAKKLKVVDHIAANRSDLLNQLGLGNAEVVEVKRSATEQIGGFLATPAIAGLLLVIGLVGLFVEIKTPGFGVPGVLGISALTLFFLGHIAGGASDWGPMVVFFVGLLLIALEVFVIPGFGLVGALGILCVLVSFFWAFGFENISTALRVITLSLTAAIAIMIALAIYVLPKTPLFRKVSLETALSSEDGCQAQTADKSLIGQAGVALTPLRPSGVVKIGNSRHDAASEGDFLEKGEEIIVTACNGFQVIVRKKDV
jgi:membrane-bound serine protease (ClpP class)